MDGHIRLAETPGDLAFGPADKRVSVSLLDPARADRLVQGQPSQNMQRRCPAQIRSLAWTLQFLSVCSIELPKFFAHQGRRFIFYPLPKQIKGV